MIYFLSGNCWLGAAFYLLASVSKEIYVPLVCLLPFIDEGTFRQRLRQTVPFLLVLAVYIPWRWYMLGVLLGGYAETSTYSLTTLFHSIANIPIHLLGVDLLGRLTLLAMFCLVALVVALGYLSPATLLLSIVLLLGPLIPVMAIDWVVIETDRFLFIPWWALSCAVALALYRVSLFGRRAALFSLAMYGFIVVVCFHQAWRTSMGLQERIDEIETQSRFLWNASETQVFFFPPELSMVGRGIIDVKKKSAEDAELPVIVEDEMQLAEFDKDDHSIWTYDSGCRCFEEISHKVPAMLAGWDAKRMIKPLSVWATYEGHVMSWQFGPYSTGTYSVVDKDVGKAIVPREGVRRTGVELGTFYVRYDSPEGWITYSDPLSLRPDTGKPLVWER